MAALDLRHDTHSDRTPLAKAIGRKRMFAFVDSCREVQPNADAMNNRKYRTSAWSQVGAMALSTSNSISSDGFCCDFWPFLLLVFGGLSLTSPLSKISGKKGP